MSNEADNQKHESSWGSQILDALSTGNGVPKAGVTRPYELRLKDCFSTKGIQMAKVALWTKAKGGEVHEEMIPLGNAKKREQFAKLCVKAAINTVIDEEKIEQWLLTQWHQRQQQEQMAQQLSTKHPRENLALEQQNNGVDLLKDPKLLYKIGALFPLIGLVGETINALLLYLALTSRVMQKIISVAVKAESSTGKSFLVDTVLKLFPPSAYVFFSGMSRQALVYSEDDYKHKMIVVAEADGIQDSEYNLRTLISENRLTYTTVEKNMLTGRMQGRTVNQEGPTGLILTTTKSRMHLENETRYLSIGLDDSEEQTKRILQSIAQQKTVTRSTLHFEPWINAQLLLQPVKVIIPYAEYLSEHMPTKPIRIRRDFQKLLSLIEASAVLHQLQRKRLPNDTIEASLADYYIAKELFERAFFQSLYGVQQNTKQIMDAIKQLHAEINKKSGSLVNLDTGDRVSKRDVTTKDLMERLGSGWTRKKIHRWAEPLEDFGWFEKKGERQATTFRPGIDPSSSESTLPTVLALADQFPDLTKDCKLVHPLTGIELSLERCSQSAEWPDADPMDAASSVSLDA